MSRQQKEIPTPSGGYWPSTPCPQIPPLFVEIELSDDESMRDICAACLLQVAGLVRLVYVIAPNSTTGHIFDYYFLETLKTKLIKTLFSSRYFAKNLFYYKNSWTTRCVENILVLTSAIHEALWEICLIAVV